jgi:hypothetical protein
MQSLEIFEVLRQVLGLLDHFDEELLDVAFGASDSHCYYTVAAMQVDNVSCVQSMVYLAS